MENTTPWSDDVRVLVDQFLDEVDRALMHRSISRTERWNIVGELESQIETVVARRVEAGESVSVEFIQSVLSSMDPPASYGEPSSGRGEEARTKRHVVVPRQPKTDRWAIAAFVVLMVSILGLSTLLNHRPEPVLAILGIWSLIIACGIGSWSMWRIRRADGWLHGLPWAFAAACGLPFAALQFAGWLLLRSPGAIFVLLALAVALDFCGCYWLVRSAWQRIARGYAPRAHTASTTAKPSEVNGVTMSPMAT